MKRLAGVVAAVGLLAACSSVVPPQPTARPVLPTATPSRSPTLAPVVLPALAPLKPADCGWPATTPLAFAAFATVANLDAEQIIHGDPGQHVFALVTRDQLELHPMIGSPTEARGFCALSADGHETESGVPDNWTFHGIAQWPQVTRPPEKVVSTGFPCLHETLVTLDAVTDVGHPATRITFRANGTCIWFPFGGNPCPALVFPDGTQRVTNAVVSFDGTNQQAFLNLFWLADGTISSDMALVTPPPGATPFG